MRFTSEVERGAWIGPRLQGWGVVGGVAPRGYEAYARVFHPAEARRQRPGPVLDERGIPTYDERSVPWAEVARVRGTVAHPAMQWGAVSRGDEYGLGDWELTPPGTGEPGPVLLAALARALPDGPVTAGVWRGNGAINGSAMRLTFGGPADGAVERGAFGIDPAILGAVQSGPLLELPGREYVLLAGRAEELREPAWWVAAGLGEDWDPTLPNLLWPDDRSWFVASEIDFDSTLVAGDASLIDRVLAAEDVEAMRVDEDTDLTIEGDTVNGRP